MNELINFVIINILFLSFVVFITYTIYNCVREHKNKDRVTFASYINQGSIPKMESLLVGLIFGTVFGFIDNFGLWMGLHKIEKYIPGGVLTKSAVGNIYSDFLGVVLGTCISIVAKEWIDYNSDDQPMWVNVIGIVIGCVFGMFVGFLITGKH